MPKAAIKKWIKFHLYTNNSDNTDPISSQAILKRTLEQKISSRLCIPHARAQRLREVQGHEVLDIPPPKGHKLYYNIENNYNPTAESHAASKFRAGHFSTKTPLTTLNIDGQEVTDQHKVSTAANDFYTKLFTKKTTSPDAQRSFLNNLPDDNKLTTEQASKLDSDFTLEELTEAINQCKQNKSNGPDGFPFEFYKEFLPVLKDHLLSFYNYLGKHGVPTLELNRALVTLIPKKDKDQTEIDNWRPISLMNTDIKIFSHLLNNRIKLLVPDLVHADQAGFVHERLITTNLDKLDQLYYSGDPWTIGLIDFKKAFDSVSHDYIQQALKAYGFGPTTCKRIAALQTNANSKLIINNSLSQGFPLQAGVRQGCPLSPTLFVISIEPLLHHLRSQLEGLNRLPSNTHMVNDNTLKTKDRTHHKGNLKFDIKTDLEFPDSNPHPFKICAFADDIAILFNSPQDIIKAGRTLSKFQKASGLTINPKKTVIQEVPGSSKPGKELIKQSTIDALLTWDETPVAAPSDSTFTYLGIDFGPREKVRELNRQHLADIERRITNFPLGGLDDRGKAWVISVFVISKLIYKLAYSSFTTADFQNLTNIACNKINNRLTPDPKTGKLNKRKHADHIIVTPTHLGGFGLLDLSKFGPNTRLVRAARVLGPHTTSAGDLLTQLYNQGAYAHLANNPLLAFTQEPENFEAPAALVRKRKLTLAEKFDENKKRATRQKAFTTTTEHSLYITPTAGTKAKAPKIPKRLRSDPEDLFLTNKQPRTAEGVTPSMVDVIPDTWKHCTSPSFHMALEQLAIYLRSNNIHLVEWDHSHLHTDQAPNQLYLYNQRRELGKLGQKAYPSPAETKFFNSFLTVIQRDHRGNPQRVNITPQLVKQHWKTGYYPLWEGYWEDQFLEQHEDNYNTALQQWEASCSSLFQVYCSAPKLGNFIQFLMLNKLKPCTSDWAPNYPSFQNVKKGCGICNFNDLPTDHAHHPLLHHIFCECPVVQRALDELHLSPLQGLADLVFKTKRIKDPDKPRIGFATWQFERELRRQGLDGHNRRLFETFKLYLLYTLKPGNPLLEFKVFQQSPLF